MTEGADKAAGYRGGRLAEFYARHRVTWEGLYASERAIIERLGVSADWRVLDVGCACGGFGAALEQRYGVKRYVGVDINEACIAVAPSVCPWGTFHSGDFLEVAERVGARFDLACSFGGADWKVPTQTLLARIFATLRSGGYLMCNFRLIEDPALDAVFEASQTIVDAADVEQSTAEQAPYKVYRLQAMLDLLVRLGTLKETDACGYWGDVPDTVTGLPWKRVFYVVMALQKAAESGALSNDRQEANREQLIAALTERGLVERTRDHRLEIRDPPAACSSPA